MAARDHRALAAALTPDTAGVVDAAALKRAKPGLHLVHLSRGARIDARALVETPDSGRLGLAMLDVASQEPPAPRQKLCQHPRVRLSPDLRRYTDEMRESFVGRIVDNIDRFRANRPLSGIVDQMETY